MKDLNNLVSFIAILLSVFALGYSIYSIERTQKCEFLYRSYDRLGELSRYANSEKIRQMACTSLLKNTSGNEVEAICKEMLPGTKTEIIKSKWQLELHRVSFERTGISELIELADTAIKQFDELEKDQEGGLLNRPTQSLRRIEEVYSSVKKFRERMFESIGGAVDTTAKDIRDLCR